MRSMTGFGAGSAPLGPGKLSLEVRSVNHRYLDVRVRLPQELVGESLFLEQAARARLLRGRFDLAVRYEGPPLASRFDTEKARRVYRELAALRDELAPGTELPVGVLAAVPDLYVVQASFDVKTVQAALARILEEALTNLDAMRLREGVALRVELAQRLESCRKLHRTIRERVPESLREHAQRVRSRVVRLVADVSGTVEPGRLEAEIALIADRGDITEEVVRLESHFSQLESLLGNPELAASPADSVPVPVGRRLDFLLQEIGREANTVGAKCQDAELGHRVMELRAEIERMREQVQNVE
jgi:uncharacterized protein (TIGR00255 family)